MSAFREVAPGLRPGRTASPLARLACASGDLIRAADMGASVGHSRLTAIGAPLDAGFVWPPGELRLTLDPCPDATAERRAQACDEAVRDALTPGQRDIANLARHWHRGHPPRFGAWLGLRAREGGIRRKLYLDVPDTAPWPHWERAVVGREAMPPGRGVRAVMLGLDGDRGGVEIYYRCHRLLPSELDTLLTRHGIAPRGFEIARMIEALTGRTMHRGVPSSDMGFSAALAEDGTPLAFTWYSTCCALLGPPQKARDAILRVGAGAGWRLESYEAFSAPVAGIVPWHGIIGMTVPRTGAMQVTATVSGYA